MATLRDKRFILVLLLTAAVAAYFWGGSRYPALNEKAAMGTETPFSGLAFSTIVKVPSEDPLVSRILYSTVNWAYTNRQGMTFGILFGALVMTLLALFERRTFRSRFANAAMGMAFGTPLGVCVNCAAPIGKALRAGGASAETALAAMVSSPTLNVIVLTMLFAMFPLYMAVIKIGLTVAFILIGIPLLTRLLPTPVPIAGGSGPDVTAGHPLDWTGRTLSSSEYRTWLQAAGWVVKTFGRNLWFVVWTTVPLMLLAGLLGCVLVTLVPLETLTDLLPQMGRRSWLAVGGVALFGALLPVPMSFDVIVTAVLWQAGLPIKYAMPLLFTMGIFSVYSLFIVWQSISRRMAVGMYVGLAGLGVVAGLIGQPYFEWDAWRQQRVVFDVLSRASAAEQGPRVFRVGGATREERVEAEIVPALQQSALLGQRWLATPEGISVERIPFAAPADARGLQGQPAKLFSRSEGSQFGLDEPYSVSVLKFEGPFLQFRGIASGDVHNDGWTDILLTTDSGLSLYANRQGKFVAQTIDIPALKDFYVVNAALVDVNSDGWLDIVFSTYRHGTYVIYNREGRFTRENLQRLPTQQDAMMSGAMAFGDVDRDGHLDIVLGNWVPPCRSFLYCDERPFNNYVLRNDNGKFQIQPLTGVAGRQTLSLLLSDLNNDGILDLVVGNEDPAPDAFLFGKGDGTFKQITRSEGIIPHSTVSTMSVASADISNTLRPAIYVGQISGTGPDTSKRREAGPAICDEISQPEHKNSCIELMRLHQLMPRQGRKWHASNCLAPEFGGYREDCIALSALLWGREMGPEVACDRLPDRWDAFRFNCHLAYSEKKKSGAGFPRDAQTVPGIGNRNVLLTPSGDGRFTDQAVAKGVQFAGFTWNAKFADLDNDEFVDLYAVNGWLPGKSRQSHFFYQNQGGQRFVDRTKESGLVSFLPTGAYTYVDLDNDGDLDIVVAPLMGPLLVYVNNSRGNRIAFELRDHVGNRSGIGSKIIVHYGPGAARHQMREIQASGGFLSFDAPIAYFGLGEYQRVERVEIQWSTGERTEIKGDFPAGARYVVQRPRRTAAR
ncbi:MAG TPA: FG-GAP-like repeat-containing protein [Candidatus Acidoferrum sp.]|nr:FG-GAP-like repeat-containing protein [Candidatus Acidoferrum sp.]